MRLGDIGIWFKGTGLSKGDLSHSGQLPAIHYGELFTDYGYKIDQCYSRTDYKGVNGKYGDLLFPASDVTPDGLGRCSALLIDNVILGGDIIILRKQCNDNSCCLCLAINANKKQIIECVTGTTVKHISSKALSQVSIQIPLERREQDRIADAFKSLENQIATTKKLLSKYESIKKATVKKLMTPTAEWQEATLGDFYTVSSGLSKGAEYFGSGYPFLSFVTVFNNPIIPDQLDDLVESSAYERKQCSVSRGDVFLTRTSETLDELGMSSVALQDYPEATFNGFTKRLRPIDDIPLCPEFMAFYLRTENFRKSICQKAAITTRASLNKDTIEKLAIAYPITSVQREIATNLMTLDNQRMVLVEELDKMKQLKQSMLQYFFGN